MTADTFAPLLRAVALELLGEPSSGGSNDSTLRWGTHGSFKADIPEGVWHDHEANVGGGVLDLLMRELRCDKAGALAWLVSKGMIAAPAGGESVFYDYRDESGAVLFRVERKGAGAGKAFLQHGPDGRGGFVCRKDCMQGVRRVPYRLPELLAADPKALVFVCEGEKDAERLASGGFIATSNAGGAGKFDRRFAPFFAGRRVVVLEDNDQAGRDHAADVVGKLTGDAVAVAVLRLPGLPEKGDVSDWINAGGTIADLQRLAEEALATATDLPEYGYVDGATGEWHAYGDDWQGPDWGGPDSAPEHGPKPLPSLDLDALAKVRPIAKQFAIERVAPMGEVTLFTGPGSAGKSLLGQQLATCAAAGLPCLRLAIAAAPAIYLTCEDDADQLHWRQTHICEALGVDMAALAGRLHLTSLRGALDNALGSVNAQGIIEPSATFHRLTATIHATGARLVFLDNVAHLFVGNENDRGDVTRFVNLLNRLAASTGAAIILIGHPPKPGQPGAVSHDYSGSTAWLNAVRSQFKIDHDRVDGLIVNHDLRVLTVGKANYAQKGEAVRFYWSKWAFIHEDELPADQARELAETIKANSENSAFLACLAERNRQKRQVSEKPTASNFAPKQFEHMPEAKGHKRHALERAMDRLFRIGAIERGFLWRDTAEGKDVHGLREVESGRPETSGNLSGNLPETPSENLRKPAEFDRKHTPYTYGNKGAAHDAAAPDDDLAWDNDPSTDD